MDKETCLARYNISNDSFRNSTEDGDISTNNRYLGSVEVWASFEISNFFKVLACAVVIFAGLLGNVSIILTVALIRSMRTTINFYVANLAAADAMICVMCMLPLAVDVLKDAQIYRLGSFMCKFQNFTEMTCLICSVLTLSAISCDRFKAVMFPLQVRAAKHRTSLVIAIIWIISILVSTPLLIVKQYRIKEWDNVNETQCIEKWPVYFDIDETGKNCVSYIPGRFIYYTVALTTLYFFPVILMITAYSLILWKVQMGVIPGEQNEANANAHSRTRRKVNQMVFIVLVAFIICWTPFQIIAVYAVFVEKGIAPISDWILEFDWIAKFLAYANSFVNPIIYGGYNKAFRDGFCNLLKRGCKRRQFGIPGRTILTFTTRFTSSRSAKSLNSKDGSKKTSQKSKEEVEMMCPVPVGDIPAKENSVLRKEENEI